ncbi:MAG TPA: hypothetical protein VGO04_32415 [Ensifer sp.]|jgi:hypothetical protein|uniref:hypothetical protein n=1 Tax=Ensifer sp. TaxID=1872086 RepID=UPI002E14C0BB|nr:hypothetical protein [Ensifer sp.]
MKETETTFREAQAIRGTGVPRRGRAKVIDPAEVVFRGHYDLAELIARYGLAPMDARKILEEVGPARTSLDRYMRERSIQISN